MFKKTLLALSGFICLHTAHGALPHYTVVNGKDVPSADAGAITRLIVTSDALGDNMTVDIWLPAGYDGNNQSRRYPVIYTHDGQNLFDPAMSFASVAWELDRTATALASQGVISVPIIVGINNRGSMRPNDYFPEKAAAYIPEEDVSSTLIWDTCSEGFYGDEHAAFVATELKPLIDSLYNTSADRTHTFALGSSMGALASLYLLCGYPDIFGGAACMSTHWTGSFRMNPDYTLVPDPVCSQALLGYLDWMIPDHTSARLYMDQGTTGWDAGYLTYEEMARETVRRHGYSETEGSLMTYDAIGAGHNEWYWQQRADRPLRFLLQGLSSGTDTVTVTPDNTEYPLFDLQGRRVVSPPPPGIYVRNGAKIMILPR